MIAPQPVAGAHAGTSFAVAGDRVVYTTVRGRTVALHDDSGGILGRVRVPPRERPRAAVVASRRRVALSIATEDAGSDPGSNGIFAGPPAGRLRPLAPLRASSARGAFRAAFDVDGARVFAAQVSGGLVGGFRWTVFAPATEGRIAVPRQGFPADFAGNRVAYARRHRLIVANWRTGAVLRSFRIGDLEDPFALRGDGSLVYVRDHAIYVVEADGLRRRLTTTNGLNYGELAAAGRRVVFAGEHGIVVVDPDGRRRRLGPRTNHVERLAASGDRVAWIADRRLFTARPSQAIGRP